MDPEGFDSFFLFVSFRVFFPLVRESDLGLGSGSGFLFFPWCEGYGMLTDHIFFPCSSIECAFVVAEIAVTECFFPPSALE